MTTVIADIADALGLSEKTVAATLNRAAIADAVFEIGLRFRVPTVAAAELIGVSTAELAAASVRAHARHHRQMVEQSRMAQDRKVGVVRVRHGPVDDPPTAEHRWCDRHHHWVHQDLMAKNRAKKSGYSNWCLACFREHWGDKVKARRQAKSQ